MLLVFSFGGVPIGCCRASGVRQKNKLISRMACYGPGGLRRSAACATLPTSSPQNSTTWLSVLELSAMFWKIRRTSTTRRCEAYFTFPFCTMYRARRNEEKSTNGNGTQSNQLKTALNSALVQSIRYENFWLLGQFLLGSPPSFRYDSPPSMVLASGT